MRDFIRISAIMLLCVTVFNSCIRQRYISQNEFAQRFNSNSQETKLEVNDYYTKDNEFNFFTKTEALREIMITLTQNEKFYVTTAELTVIKDGKDLDENEKEELLKTVTSILSVIINCEESEISSELSEIGFDKDKFCFLNTTETFDILKANCFFYSNSEMLSFQVKIK